MRRRAFLATCAAVGLAGCLGSDSTAGTPGTDTEAGTPAGPDPPTDASADTGSPTATAKSTVTSSAATSPTVSESATGTASTATGTASTATGTAIHPGYDTTEVRLRTPGGERLASVTAAIADTSELRYTGLSDTENLPPDRGMLFVYDEVGDHTFVMRRMDFGIDIVYADDEGVITEIHHAPAPGPNEDGNEQRYPGRGQYVLEVNYEFTTEHGVETGDVLAFDL